MAHFSQESDQWFSYLFTHFYRHIYLVTVHSIISHSVLMAELSNKSYVHLPPPADKTHLQQEEIPGAWCSGSKGTTHRRRRKLKITKWVREPWERFWPIVRLHYSISTTQIEHKYTACIFLHPQLQPPPSRAIALFFKISGTGVDRCSESTNKVGEFQVFIDVIKIIGE